MVIQSVHIRTLPHGSARDEQIYSHTLLLKPYQQLHLYQYYNEPYCFLPEFQDYNSIISKLIAELITANEYIFLGM